MSDTIRLALPRMDAGQAQKHVTHNEALGLVDALVHLSVLSRALAAAPAAPADGARYIVPANGTGAFAGKGGSIASFDDGAWRFLAPKKGWRAFVESENRLFVFDGANWSPLAVDVSEVQNLRFAGINTNADAGNPLSARVNNALFTAINTGDGGTGDLRVKLNKQQASATVSQLYQSNWSGRAETGLMGDDRYRIKVSADGGAWHEALNVDPATGRVFFPNGGCDLAATVSVTTGTPSAYYLASPTGGPLPNGALFWMIPHVPNATALNATPSLQVEGSDASPLPLKNFDGSVLPQGLLEAGRAIQVRRIDNAYLVQTPRPLAFFNLIEDAGRFAGATEPLGQVVSAFADPAFLASANGATRVGFGIARLNSASFGGTAPALPQPITDLVTKIRSGAALLNGAEFCVMQVTVGTGTASGAQVQATNFYLPMTTARILAREQTFGFYFRVMSGSAVIAPDSSPRVLVDGVAHNHLADTPDRIFTAASGWKHAQHWISVSGNASAQIFPLRVTPGAVLLVALPALVAGFETLPWDIGIVPSLRGWR